MTDVQACLLGVVACVLGACLTPAVVRRLPEPAPRPDDELSEQERAEGPKEPYVDVAELPWLLPVAAACAGLAGGVVGYVVGGSWLLVGLLPLVVVLVLLSLVDLRTRTLPTVVVLGTTGAMAVLAVAHAGLVGDWADLGRAAIGLLGARTLFWVMWFLSPGLGFGDVRLAALLGLSLGYLGWGELLVGLYAGFLLLGVPGVVMVVVRRRLSYLKTHYPFGPFLAVGALVGIAVGQPLFSHLVTV